jgi:hypothetical protein
VPELFELAVKGQRLLKVRVQASTSEDPHIVIVSNGWWQNKGTIQQEQSGHPRWNRRSQSAPSCLPFLVCFSEVLAAASYGVANVADRAAVGCNWPKETKMGHYNGGGTACVVVVGI